MPLNPNGGSQQIRVPWRPLVAIGEGTIVRVDGQYAEVQRATVERRGGASGLYLTVIPVPVGSVLTGFGELAVDVQEIEED